MERKNEGDSKVTSREEGKIESFGYILMLHLFLIEIFDLSLVLNS